MIKLKILVALIILALAAGCSPIITDVSTPTPTAFVPTPTPTTIATGTPTSVPSSLPSIADIVEQVRPAVVYIAVEYDERWVFGTIPSNKSGSGAIMSPEGYILTNYHVIEDATKIEVLLPDEDGSYEAQIVGTDPLGDLAVIKIEGNDFPSVEFGDASRLRIGDWVIALGSALGIVEGGPTVTMGIVGNLGRSFTINKDVVKEGEPPYFAYYDVIQTDAAINPGNSGGPLVDLEGKVIGINTFVFTDAQNIGFAVSTDTARRVYEDLLAYERVKRPYLGASLDDVTPAVAAELNLFINRGVRIAYIYPAGPVAREGLQVNDVITRFEDQEVTDASELIKLLWQHEVGDRVKVTFWRGDQEQEVWVTLGERPEGS
ncbi:S1C family serine protease [Chloroflexota bacterium]